MNADAPPAVSYWHVWTDADGISHQSRCRLTEFQKAAIQPSAAPQWIGSKITGPTSVFGGGPGATGIAITADIVAGTLDYRF